MSVMKPDKRIADRDTTPGKIELYRSPYGLHAHWMWNCAIGQDVTYCYFGDAKTFEEAKQEMLYHMKRVHDV